MLFWPSKSVTENPKSTGLVLFGLGVLVTLLSYMMLKSNERLRAGIKGFGLGHILLGALDMLRASYKQR